MGTTATERASVTAILADLILLQSRDGLPMPRDMAAYVSHNHSVDIQVTTLSDVQVWAAALGETGEYAVHTSTYAHRGPIHSTRARDRSGWTVRVTASIDELPAEPLSAETLAALESVK